MTQEDFWFGEPRLVKVYKEAHGIRNQIRNQELWIQGMYNYRAITSVAESLAYAIGGGKGSKPSKYPDKPFALTEEEQQAEVERNKRRTLAWVEQGQK